MAVVYSTVGAFDFATFWATMMYDSCTLSYKLLPCLRELMTWCMHLSATICNAIVKFLI